MDIAKTQLELRELLKSIQHPRLGAILGLHEELGELDKIIMNWEIYGERDRENLQQECADVLFSLLDVANAYDVELDAACRNKLEDTKKKIKKWERKYGTRLHNLRELLDRGE